MNNISTVFDPEYMKLSAWLAAVERSDMTVKYKSGWLTIYDATIIDIQRHAEDTYCLTAITKEQYKKETFMEPNPCQHPLWKPERIKDAPGRRCQQCREWRAESCWKKPKPEVNADGDSIEDMKAVQKLLGSGSVQNIIDGHVYKPPLLMRWGATSVNDYRITAKHADKFDAACMDWQTWKDGTHERNLIIRLRNNIGLISYGIDALNQWDGVCSCCYWTAITRAQYDQETKTEAQTRGIKSVFVEAETTRRGYWVPLSEFAKAVAEEMQKS